MSDKAPNPSLALATFGNGCFWCTEAIFTRINGVSHVQSGYSGGQTENPTYREVCTGQTGHAEVVQITFDPSVVSFESLLRVFFATHDPTTLNRQGNDVGTQYRSVIFYHNAEQQADAERIIKLLEEAQVFAKPIVTEVQPFKKFFPAEDYHNQYFASHGHEPYCQLVIHPKVEKFEAVFTEFLKPDHRDA